MIRKKDNRTREQMLIALMFGEENINFADGVTDYLYLYFADWLNIRAKEFENQESFQKFIQKYSKSILDLSDLDNIVIMYGNRKYLEVFKFIVKQNLSIDLSFIK